MSAASRSSAMAQSRSIARSGVPASRIPLYAFLCGSAVFFAVPLYVMIVTSLKSLEEIHNGTLLSLPRAPTLDPWVQAWGGACIGLTCSGLKTYFANSLAMAAPAVAISTAIGAINGYALSKWKFPGSETFFALLLLGCFIPFQMVLIPVAQMLRLLGLFSSLPGLVLVHVIFGLSFTTLFFRNFYAAFPDEIIKAALIDGAGFWSTLLRVVLPVSGPMITVTVIWQFTNIWNDFLFGASFAGLGPSSPITVALNNLVNSSTGVKEYNVDMAGAIIAALPTLVVYIAAGRYFVRGLMAGAIKG
jgi:glucose/mannose transport system permease protein